MGLKNKHKALNHKKKHTHLESTMKKQSVHGCTHNVSFRNVSFRFVLFCLVRFHFVSVSWGFFASCCYIYIVSIYFSWWFFVVSPFAGAPMGKCPCRASAAAPTRRFRVAIETVPTKPKDKQKRIGTNNTKRVHKTHKNVISRVHHSFGGWGTDGVIGQDASPLPSPIRAWHLYRA